MLCKPPNIFLRIPYLRFLSAITKKIDFSKVPKLDEADLEENFVRGDGPGNFVTLCNSNQSTFSHGFSLGGQAIATTNNCVVLKHKPTNLIVKYHGTRSLPKNREEARRLMIVKLDDHFNKEDSIENQRKRLERIKYNKSQSKSEKLRKLKMEFKEANKLNDLD